MPFVPETPTAPIVPTPATPSAPSIWSQAGDAIKNTIGQGVANAILGPAITGAASAVSPSFSWTRITAFLLGLILIVGGLFLFKPVQQTVVKAVKAGAA
jgi:hypothetical protein